MPGVASLAAVQRAVDEFDVSSFQLETEPAALAAARGSLDRSGLLLLGEVHGVRQNSLLVRALMAALGVTGLALEWPAGLADAVSGFLAGGRVFAPARASGPIPAVRSYQAPREARAPASSEAGWFAR